MYEIYASQQRRLNIEETKRKEAVAKALETLETKIDRAIKNGETHNRLFDPYVELGLSYFVTDGGEDFLKQARIKFPLWNIYIERSEYSSTLVYNFSP